MTTSAVAVRDTDTQVAPRRMGALSAIQQMQPRELATLKATVAIGATDEELALFLELANRYQLDPFLKEIWCVCDVKNGKRNHDKPAMIMSGRDGYLAHANRSPLFDGIESAAVHEHDTFRRLADGSIEHTYGTEDRGKVIGAYALVWRKDRTRPAYFFAPWADYGARNAGSSWSPWSKYPTAMIVKVAESMALKRAFSISGLVTQEEMGADHEASVTVGEPQAAPTGAELWEALVAIAGDKDALVAALKAAGVQMRKYGDLLDGDVYEAARAVARQVGGVTPDPDDETVEGEVTDEGDDDPVITEDQRRRLEAIARELGRDHAWMKSIAIEAGFASTKDITQSQYENFEKAMRAEASYQDQTQAPADA
jgi:phage recombination protein Bet